jgi:hypothetical protein
LTGSYLRFEIFALIDLHDWKGVTIAIIVITEGLIIPGIVGHLREELSPIRPNASDTWKLLGPIYRIDGELIHAPNADQQVGHGGNWQAQCCLGNHSSWIDTLGTIGICAVGDLDEVVEEVVFGLLATLKISLARIISTEGGSRAYCFSGVIAAGVGEVSSYGGTGPLPGDN